MNKFLSPSKMLLPIKPNVQAIRFVSTDFNKSRYNAQYFVVQLVVFSVDTIETSYLSVIILDFGN